jgi:hypothetical protein
LKQSLASLEQEENKINEFLCIRWELGACWVQHLQTTCATAAADQKEKPDAHEPKESAAARKATTTNTKIAASETGSNPNSTQSKPVIPALAKAGILYMNLILSLPQFSSSNWVAKTFVSTIFAYKMSKIEMFTAGDTEEQTVGIEQASLWEEVSTNEDPHEESQETSVEGTTSSQCICLAQGLWHRLAR